MLIYSSLLPYSTNKIRPSRPPHSRLWHLSTGAAYTYLTMNGMRIKLRSTSVYGTTLKKTRLTHNKTNLDVFTLASCCRGTLKFYPRNLLCSKNTILHSRAVGIHCANWDFIRIRHKAIVHSMLIYFHRS